MAWTVYRWDDDEAPQLSAQGNSLQEVLRGCLCDGYGVKSAAGWTEMAYTNDKSIYVNAGTGHGLSVIHAANSSNATVVGVEFGNNNGPYFPTTTQAASGLYWYVSATTDATLRPWIVFADEKRFYLWAGAGLTTAQGVGSTGGVPTFFAGDIESMSASDPYCFMVIGGTSPGTGGLYFGLLSTSPSYPLFGHYIARASTASGSSINVAKASDSPMMGGFTVMGNSGASYPAFGGGLLLAPVNIIESTNVLRGQMPKLWNPLHQLPGSPGDTFGGTGALSGKTFILLDASTTSNRARIALETS